MIAILFASACVATCCLQMAARIPADPHIFICGRHGERLNTRQGFAVGQCAAIRGDIVEAVVSPSAANAGIGIADVHETGGIRNFHRLQDE